MQRKTPFHAQLSILRTNKDEQSERERKIIFIQTQKEQKLGMREHYGIKRGAASSEVKN